MRDKIELDARRILEDVSKAGTYNEGHIKGIVSLANQQRIELQEELKTLLNINECHHE